MMDNPIPEMMRLSLSDLALRIKIMKVHLGSSIEDVLSRALDPPLSVNIQRAVSMLVEVRLCDVLLNESLSSHQGWGSDDDRRHHRNGKVIECTAH